MTRLLYVEDDPLLRTVTTMALEDAGYEVVLAEDGREALRLLEEHGGFDFVVSDISMPGGVSGLDVAQAARQSRPGCRMVLMSGYATSQLPALPDGLQLHEHQAMAWVTPAELPQYEFAGADCAVLERLIQSGF